MEGRELPVGWEQSALGDLLEFAYGKPLPARSREDGDVPVYGSNGVVGKHKEALTSAPCIIIGRKGSVGEVHFSEVPAWPIDTTYYVSEPGPFEPRCLFFLLKNLGLNELNRATAIPGLNRQDAYQLNVGLPPEGEQHRIAAKLDTTLAAVEACRLRLDGVAGILKRFRQAVLAAATTGELTREWREKRGIDIGWMPCRLAEIAEIQGGITKDSKKQLEEYPEIPYLRVANVQRGFLDLNEVAHIKVPPSRLDVLLLKAGDILFNEGGDRDKVGRGWIWEGQIRECVFQNHVFRARLHNSEDEPKFVSWWSNTRGIDHFLGLGKQTTNLASISKTTLGSLPINLPSPAEQKEIVRRVEELFSYADQLEGRLATARKIVDRLTPALLAKAFRGELVPQDPSDEPASVLLERIRAARQAEADAGKPSRRGRRKAAANPDQIPLDAAPVPSDLLSGLLQECGALSERALLAASELEPGRFSEQLQLELQAGTIREELEEGERVLVGGG